MSYNHGNYDYSMCGIEQTEERNFQFNFTLNGYLFKASGLVDINHMVKYLIILFIYKVVRECGCCQILFLEQQRLAIPKERYCVVSMPVLMAHLKCVFKTVVHIPQALISYRLVVDNRDIQCTTCVSGRNKSEYGHMIVSIQQYEFFYS